MNASSQVQNAHGSLVSDAHRIAWYFLKGTGKARDEYAEQVLLSRIIIGLAARGITHRIRLANVAIDEFVRQVSQARRDVPVLDRLATN